MAVPGTSRRQYDHNLRNAGCATGDPGLFDGIPTETQRSWIRRGPANVVRFGEDTSALLIRIERLERINRRLRKIIRLPLTLTRAFGFALDGNRMPSAAGKTALMTTVRRGGAGLARTA